LLRNELASGNVSAFVGAGLSVGAGLPGWYDLISELARRIDHDDLPPRKWASGDVLIDASQYYINTQGMNNLVRFLKDRLDTREIQPTAAHRALTRLPISVVFTANYDDLLEQAYKETGRRVQVVVNDTDIPFMRSDPGSVNIIKLYGDLDQPETIVLTRQQYETFFILRPQMVKLLETELGRSTMLYLGWSHSDPHFNFLFGELSAHYKQYMRAGYAVFFNITDAQKHEMKRRQIQLVDFTASQKDRTAQLAEWLNGLTP